MVKMKRLKVAAEHWIGVLIVDLSLLSFFAVIGTQTRVWVAVLFRDVLHVTNPDSALFVDLPANALGCFVMGFIATRSTVLSQLHPSVHTAVTTGYLGCVTTFASWNFSCTVLFAKAEVANAIVALILGTEVALVSWSIGKHVALWFETQFPEQKDTGEEAEVEFVLASHALLALAPLFMIGTVAAFAVAATVDSNGTHAEFWWATILAPVGAVCRWLLAKLNGRTAWFPIGTFSANISAVAINCIVYSILLTNSSIFAAFHAIPIGLAGNLSTVSTFINEVHNFATRPLADEEDLAVMDKILRALKRQYLYIFASLGTAQLLAIVVYGPVYWTRA